MILDTHHHLWKYNSVDYVWMDDRMSILQEDYLPDHLQSNFSSSSVIKTVTVQARQMLKETEWLLQQSDIYPFIAGVVGWVELCSPNISEQLNRFHHHPKLVGVRHVVHDEPDVDFMLRADFIHGISLLQEYDLTYDLLLFPKHLPNALKLVEKFPDQKFVIDHIAKPSIQEQRMDNWLVPMTNLASYPNVYCKLSGMVTEANWSSWKAAHFDPYLDVLFDLFSPDRLMVGSDWPVCLLAGNYQKVMSLVPSFMNRRGISDNDQKKVLLDTGEKFYGLIHRD